ncbi:MAG: methyltransferase domain-containing protein, partial [Burkholderiales bacterium]|nr:methyltransferase domain-containing protein [Burkholderiales bacterium]
MSMAIESEFPDPTYLYEEFQAFHRSLALRAALELDIFTHIDSGATTVDALAKKCHASERGIRILCDYLVVTGHLLKESANYGLPVNSALYLSTNSSAYIGSAASFLTGDDALRSFGGLSEAVRAGTCVVNADACFQAAYWKGFAESMASFAKPVARMAAACVDFDCDRPLNILDVAAGHGLYGLAMADRNPQAHIYALDSPAVLEVAERNARLAGIAERYHLIPGDVFETELGGPYDLIVAANFVHHFDKPTNTTLFNKFIS